MANTKIQSEQIVDDVALGGNPTTTTQSAGNNTTRVATTAFVTTAVSNLVDSAPSNLDTLNELAAAMNDNASFFSTVLPLSGGTMTGGLVLGGTTPTLTIGDAGEEDTKIVFDGNAQDYYIGLDDSADDLVIGKGSTVGTNPAITIDSSQRVGIVASSLSRNFTIYSTDQTDLAITAAANQYAQLLFGDPDDDNIGGIGYNNSNNSMIFTTNTSTAMTIDSSQRVGIGTSSPGAPLNVTSAYSSGAITTALKLATVGGYNSNSGTALDFGSDQGNYSTWLTGRIAAPRTGDNWGGSLVFSTNDNSAATGLATAMTIDSRQNAGLGVTPESWNSNFRALQIGPWGSLATTTSGNGESFRLNANFYNDGSAEKYLGTGYALMFREAVTGGSFIFSSSQASGSADGSIASWYHSEIHNHSWAATLETTTSDGSDNWGVGLDAGGGAGSTARGAGLWVYGNEHGSYPGSLIAQMGASGSFRVMTGASGDEHFRVFSDGSIGLGPNWNGTKDSSFKVMADQSGWASVYHNDGNGSNRYGIKIGCGADNAAGTNYAMGFDNGNFTSNQGYITFSGGTVNYGAFTAHHPCVIPDADNDPDSSENAYPYGTLLETISLSYTQTEETDTERGIRYNVQKSSGAYSKKVLGAYGSSMNDAPHNPDNEHQALVLGDGHILCNNEKGNISVGDGICTSSTAGIGMKADKMAMIIGIAQEDVTFSGSETKLVAVQYGLQQFTPWTD